MLLPNTDGEAAALVAEKLVIAVRSLALSHAGINEDAIVTMSFGVVSIIPDRSLTAESLMRQADEKLYQAKNNGRDQWVI